MNFNPYFKPYTKITFKWITDINIRVKTIKLRRKQRNKSLRLWVRQRFLKYDKRKIYERKNW